MRNYTYMSALATTNVDSHDDDSVRITILGGISGQDKRSLTCKIVEESGLSNQIMNVDFDDILMRTSGSADISTFLDMPSVRARAESIDDAFGMLVSNIRERASDIRHVFLQVHLSYFKNSELMEHGGNKPRGFLQK